MKRPNLSPIAKFMTKNKLKMVRGYSYVSAAAIPFLVAKDLADIFPSISIWIFLTLGLAGIWILGHIDWNHLWKYELEWSFTKNPEWVKQMDEVKKKKGDNL